MNIKDASKKLQLNAETLRAMNPEDLAHVAGGGTGYSAGYGGGPGQTCKFCQL